MDDLHSTPNEIIPFSQQFLPEIWAIVIEMLDRTDLLNCSVLSKELNRESSRLIWTGFTLPIFRSEHVSFDDISRYILDKPERGRSIKALTLHFMPAPLTREAALDLINVMSPQLERTLELIPNATSVKILVMPLTRSSPPSGAINISSLPYHLEGPGPTRALNTLEYGNIMLRHIAKWMHDANIVKFKSIHLPFHDLVPLWEACPSLSSISFRLPFDATEDLGAVLSDDALPALNTLESSVYTAPRILSRTRPIVTLSLLGDTPIAGAHDRLVGRLRETNTIRIIHCMSANTWMLAQAIKDLEPTWSGLSVVSEKEHGLTNRGPHYDEAWFDSFGILLRSISSVHTYILRCTKFSVSDWSMPITVQHFSDMLDNHVRPPLNYGCTRIILELGIHGTSQWRCWIFEYADSTGSWTSRRDNTQSVDLAARDHDLYLNST